MKTIVSLKDEVFSEYASAIEARRVAYSEALEQDVLSCYAACKNDPIKTIVEYTREFDQRDFTPESIYLDLEHVDRWVQELTISEKEAFCLAEDNIVCYNRNVMQNNKTWQVAVSPGHLVGAFSAPVKTALLWVPAKKGALVSTAQMLVLAARTAGVENIIVAMPPGGDIDAQKKTLAVSRLCGATHFLIGNGVALLASAALGVLNTPKPNVMFGPRPNIISLTMLHAMKYGVRSQPGIGPTDSLCFAPDTAYDIRDAQIMARDLLNELEHGPDSYSYLITTNVAFANAVSTEITHILSGAIARKEIITTNFENRQAGIILCETYAESVAFINTFAPEHLMIFTERDDPENFSDITNCGEILFGKNTPFSAANYCIGVPAVLPTNGFAQAFGAIDANSFMKKTAVARLDGESLASLKNTVEVIGEIESLPNHITPVSVRVG